MADVNANDIVTVAVRAEDQGTEDVVNVYDLELTSVTGLTAAQALSDLEDWVELICLILDGIQTIRYIYRELTAYNRTQSTLLGGATITNPPSGIGTGNSLPSGNAGLISFPTNIARVVGRKYIGGFAVGSVDADGTLSSATTSVLLSAGNTIRAPYTGTNGSWQYGVWRSATNSLVVPLGTIVTDVMAYQRRRRAGRGS